MPIPGVLVNGLNGVFDIGQVTNPGLTEQEFVDTFSSTNTRWQYVGGLGQGVTGDFNLVYVPEPTSLLMIGAVGLLLSRRRRTA